MTRPYLADPEQVDRDELAARRLDRDRHREPRTGIIRPEPRVTQGRAFMVAVDTSLATLDCPRCRAHVYAPRDSHNERIDCATCDARLVTRIDIAGQLSAVEVG